MNSTGSGGDMSEGISRRKLLVGGGVGIGLLVGWSLWPRHYPSNLGVADGEHLFGPWLKIAEDGQIVVAIPQSEAGQGVYTALAQIVAGELGADWRTVAVQPVGPSPNFANHLIGREWATAFVPEIFDPANAGGPALSLWDRETTNDAFVITGGSSSIRQFEGPCREAGASARALLCQAAAARWDVDWETLETDGGFVIWGRKRIAFADLVVEASALSVPDPVPLRASPRNDLSGETVARLDTPAKIDGSANFAGDIRLPDMLYASIRGGPIGDRRLKSVNKAAGLKIRHVVKVVTTDHWIAALATNWWSANRALDAMAPVFENKGPLADSGDIAASLRSALTEGSGKRQFSTGDFDEAWADHAPNRRISTEYNIAAAMHAPVETRSATAHYRGGRLQLWMASQAPQAAIEAAAKAIGISPRDVIYYPVFAGGSFDRNFDNRIAAQIAVLAVEAGRPVQLVWSRAEDSIRDHVRAPLLGHVRAMLDEKDMVKGLGIKIAAPSSMRELAARLGGEDENDARAGNGDEYDPLMLDGARPPYNIDNVYVDHFPVALPVPTGPWRAMAHGYNAFIIESCIDELAHKAGIEPLSFRMQMLVGQTRLARCLTGVAAMAGWDGGASGSRKGIACHSMRGSHIAIIATTRIGDKAIGVDAIHAMVDCGRMINPDLVRQQIESGIVFGLAQALGSATEFEKGLPTVRHLRDLGLPGMAEVPEINIEFVESDADPGGVSEIGVPAVAPAIANALFAASGLRLRDLPLLSRGL